MPSNEIGVTSRVKRSPGVHGGDACIRDTRHSVAGLVQWRRLGLSDADILDRHPDLSLDDLEAAWDYDRENPEEIERAIREDEDA